jgi:hypothetical protein
MSKVTRRPVKPHFYTEGLERETALAGLKYSLHKTNLHSVVWHQRTGTASFKMAIEEAERDVRGIEVRGWKSDASCRVTLVPRQSVLCGGRGSPDYQAIRITKRNSVVQAYSMLTPWCRVLPEQLTGLQLVNKFPAFHGTRRFITALTSVRFCAMLPLETLPPGEPNGGVVRSGTGNIQKINTQRLSKCFTPVIIIMGLLSLLFHCNKEIREQDSYDTREIMALLLSS